MLHIYPQENEKLEQCIRDLKMSAAEMSEKNLVLENEICKLKERPQLLVSENSMFAKLITNQYYK